MVTNISVLSFHFCCRGIASWFISGSKNGSDFFNSILLVRVLFLNINYFQLIIVFVYNMYLYFF